MGLQKANGGIVIRDVEAEQAQAAAVSGALMWWLCRSAPCMQLPLHNVGRSCLLGARLWVPRSMAFPSSCP